MNYRLVLSKLTIFLLCAFVFFIPIWINIALLILPYLILFAFLSTPLKGIWKQWKNKRFIIIVAVFLLLHFISGLFSQNVANGLNNAFKLLAILGIPMLFVLLTNNQLFKPNQVIYSFILGCFAIIVFTICRGLYLSFSNYYGFIFFDTRPFDKPWENYLLHTQLSYLTHPTYMAMYMSFAIILLFNLIKTNRNISRNLLYFLGIVVLLIYTYMLSSRMGLIVCVASFFLGIIGQFRHWRRIVSVLAIVGAVLACVVVIKFLAPKHVATQDIEDNSEQVEEQDVTSNRWKYLGEDPRPIIWSLVPELIHDKPIVGHGLGNSYSELMKMYKKYGLFSIWRSGYGVHNQYLNELISLGLIGLAMILFLLIYPLIYFRKAPQYFPAFAFIAIVSVQLLTESMLSRIIGAMFFAVFYGLYFCTDFIYKENDLPKTIKKQN